jgi:hypothetical protein
MRRLILATVCFLAAASAAPGADRVRPITFDKVKFEMKQGDPFEQSLLTDDIKKLDGKTVRVSGWMLPSFQQSGIKAFILVRDNQECCFGPKAALYDCMVVEMTGGATAEFSTYQITVEGVFKVKEVKGPDGKHLAIYHLDAHSVK